MGFGVWGFSVFETLCNLHDPFHDVRSAVAAHNIHTAAGAGRHDAPREFSRANVVGSADVGEVKGDAAGGVRDRGFGVWGLGFGF